MEKNMKHVFGCVEDADVKMNKLKQLLEQKLEIEVKIEDGLGGIKLLSVPKEKYEESLIVGTELANENGLEIYYLDFYGIAKPLNYFSLMYNYFPKTRNIRSYDINEVPPDVKKYIDKLEEFLGIDDYVYCIYNAHDHALELLMKRPFEEYDMFKEKCKQFIKNLKDNNPFVKTEMLKMDGELEVEQVTKTTSFQMETYFNESMFIDGLFRPEGSNIAPKAEIDENLKTGYHYNMHNYGVRHFDIESVVLDENHSYNLTCEINGSFLVYDEKNYNYYWDNELGKQTKVKDMPFIMLDNGEFNSLVEVIDEETISVNTTINLIRNIVGYNFDQTSTRDGIFKSIPHEDCKATINMVEYYKLLSCKNRLLHYSPDSPFFEIYDLPNGFQIENGIVTGIHKLEKPKVFDDVSYDETDKDLEEVKTILANEKAKTYTKK